MIPLRICIENFMNHRHSDISCKVFNSALIVGKNKNNDRESNGVGKTTVFSAIQYALFGVVPTSVLDKIVRDGADKAKVTFEFELPNRGIYKVTRTRTRSKKSDVTLHQEIDGKWVSKSGRSARATDQAISELIKISANAFKYSVVFAQSDLSGLSEADNIKGGRLKILEEPLNIVKYARLKKIGEDKARPIKRDIERIESAIATLGSPEEEISSAKAELDYCEAIIKEKTVQIANLKTSIKEKQDTIADIKQTIGADDTNVLENISQLEARSKRIESFIKKEESSKEENERILAHKKKKVSLLEDEIETLDAKKEVLLGNKLRDRQEIESDLSKTSEDEVLGAGYLAQYEAEYKQANKSIPKDDFCPSCEQPITSEYRKELEDKVANILSEMSVNITDTKSNLEKCRKKKNKLREELDAATKQAADLISIDTNIKSLNDRIETYHDSIEELPKQIENNKKEIVKFKNEHQEVVERLSTLRETAQKSSVASLNKQVFALTEDLRVYEKGLDSANHEYSELKGRQGAAEERIRTSTINLEKLKEYRSELEILQSKYKIRRLVIDAFGTDIPKFIIHTILDELQVESNKLLSELRPGLELQFNEGLELSYSLLGSARDYDQLSIGQKVYIALSLKLGLAKVIQHKLGVDLQFLLLDEVDQSLDEAGVEAFTNIIKKWQNKFKIFVITHNAILRHNPVFGKVIVVHNDGDGAKAYFES